MAVVANAPGKSHDLILKDRPSSPVTLVNLLLDRDKKLGTPRWREFRAAPYSPRRAQGSTGYTDLDPSIDLVHSWEDFSGGALVPRFDGRANRYAYANGCDLRWANLATLGMKKNSVWFLARNLDAEHATVDPWTETDTGAITRITKAVDVREGSAAWGFDAAQGGGDTAYITLTNPTVYQSREITFYLWVRTTESLGSPPLQHEATARLFITDDNATTNGSSVNFGTATDWTLLSVTRTIHSSVTFVRLGIEREAGGASVSGTPVLTIDGGFVVPTGGIVNNGVAENSDALYGIFGRVIALWNESDDVWNAVHVHATATATSIAQYGTQLFIAFGGDTPYIYGASTSWTTSNLTDDAKYAHFFVVSRGVLWKSRSDATATGTHNFIASSTSPLNGGSWSAEYTVGSSDRAITRLYAFRDTVYVGKEDGLHVYLRVYEDGTSADEFVNDTEEWVVFVNPENFARGAEWHKLLYLTASQQSLFRHTGGAIEDLSGLLFAPRLEDFGGRVRALTGTPAELFFLLDTPTTDTTDAKETWLMSLRDGPSGLVVHTLEKVAIGEIAGLHANRGFLWAFGRSFVTDASDYQASIYRWTLPAKTVAPALDSSPAINTSGNFVDSIIDYGLPDQDKAFIKVVVTHKDNLDAEHTIVVKCGFDDEAPDTHTIGAINTSGSVHELYFNAATFSNGGDPEDEAVAKSIHLQVELATDDTDAPQVYTIAIHATLKPPVVKTWECYIQVGDRMRNLQGLEDEDLTLFGAAAASTKGNVIAALHALEAQDYPLVMQEDMDEDGMAVVTRVQIVRGSLARVPQDESDKNVEIWRFQVQEIQASDLVNDLLELFEDTRLLWLPEVSETLTSTDRSPHARTLTYSESVKAFDTPAYQRLGNRPYVTFNGADEEADTPDADDLSFGDGSTDEAFSIVALVLTTTTTGNRVILAKDNDGTAEEYRFQHTGNTVQIALNDESASAILARQFSNALAVDTWTLLVMTYDGSASESGLRLYKDRVRKDDTNNSSGSYTSMENTAALVHIASRNTTKERFWDGSMALVALVGKELSAADVDRLCDIINQHFGLSL